MKKLLSILLFAVIGIAGGCTEHCIDATHIDDYTYPILDRHDKLVTESKSEQYTNIRTGKATRARHLRSSALLRATIKKAVNK